MFPDDPLAGAGGEGRRQALLQVFVGGQQGAVVPQLDGRLIAEQGDKEQEKGIEQVQQHQGQPSEVVWLDVKPAGGQE